MRSLRDPTARNEIVARVERIPADCQRQWGRMESSKVLPHLADQLRMAMGNIAIRGVRGPFRFAPMRYLVLHVLPWPKGRAKAPVEAFTTAPAGWEADRTALLELIERFAKTPASDLNRVHPLFGRMTCHDWDVLSYRHLDHHLRQFGA